MNTLLKGPVSERAINIFNHAALDRSAKVSSRWNLGRSSALCRAFVDRAFCRNAARGQVDPQIRHDVTYFPDLIATSGRRIFANYWYDWERGGISHS
jgi:hypothetical protein